MKIHDFALADQDWIGLMNFKNFADRTGPKSTFSGEDWTRNEKFHSPLISAWNPGLLYFVSFLQC